MEIDQLDHIGRKGLRLGEVRGHNAQNIASTRNDWTGQVRAVSRQARALHIGPIVRIAFDIGNKDRPAGANRPSAAPVVTGADLAEAAQIFLVIAKLGADVQIALRIELLDDALVGANQANALRQKLPQCRIEIARLLEIVT